MADLGEIYGYDLEDELYNAWGIKPKMDQVACLVRELIQKCTIFTPHYYAKEAKERIFFL